MSSRAVITDAITTLGLTVSRKEINDVRNTLQVLLAGMSDESVLQYHRGELHGFAQGERQMRERCAVEADECCKAGARATGRHMRNLKLRGEK